MERKRKLFYWALIVFFTFVPIVIDLSLKVGYARFSTFIWSLFLIPNILIMILYPKWRFIIGAAAFYSILKYVMEYPEIKTDKIEVIVLVAGSFVNGAILMLVGYFWIKYNKLLRKVEKLTLIDSLTGLYNRRYFDLYLEKAIPISQRDSLVLIMLDIDHFKRVNDQYGHQCGDIALKHLSDIIRNNVRKSDGYVRFGGEEFAIILPNTDLSEGRTLAGRIREAVEQTIFYYKNKPIQFTISLGVALYCGEQHEEFIEKADNALYQAKENGRNQVIVIENN